MNNLRTQTILKTMEAALAAKRIDKYNIIEIGCMFNMNEGLSTYEIARFIKDKSIAARFVSIEYDAEHIEASKKILNKLDKSLLERVQFICGHSLVILPSVLEEMEEVHFASIDGGAHPEICLKEFELISGALSSECALVIDDMVELKPTKNYPGLRIFGKCTLIYPALIMADYLRSQAQNIHMSWDFIPRLQSDIIPSLNKKAFSRILEGDTAFQVVGEPTGHRMLVYGSPSIVNKIKESEKHFMRKMLGYPKMLFRSIFCSAIL